MLSFIEHIAYIAEGYAVWLFDIISGRKSKRTQSRLKICNECEHNKSGICEQCGCIIKAKARVYFELDEDGKSIDGCPDRKW